MIGSLIVRRAAAHAFDCLSRRDLPGFLSAWSDDGVFIYPGDVPASGTHEGKAAVENWFRTFFEHFPRIQFDVQEIGLRNIFSFSGTNVASVHWKVELVNRDGRVGHNSGVTVVTVEKGRVVQAKDYLFSTGDGFREQWGVL